MRKAALGSLHEFFLGVEGEILAVKMNEKETKLYKSDPDKWWNSDTGDRMLHIMKQLGTDEMHLSGSKGEMLGEWAEKAYSNFLEDVELSDSKRKGKA